MRLAPPCTAPIDTPTEIEKKLNGSRPARKYRGKLLRPLGSPICGTARNTTRKITLKIAICVSGFSKLHAQPRTDFLYLVLSSFSESRYRRFRCAAAERRVMRATVYRRGFAAERHPDQR